MDRSGAATALPYDPGHYFAPRLAPDGSRLAVSISGSENVQLRLLEPARRSG